MSGSILSAVKLESFEEIHGFSFVWQTPLMQQDSNTSISSPDFKSGRGNEFTWRLTILPDGSDRQSKDSISVRLAILDLCLNDARLYVGLSFIGKDYNEYMTREVSFKLKGDQIERSFDFPKNDVYSDQLPLLTEGKLTIKLVIYHDYDEISASMLSEYRPMRVYDCSRRPLGSEEFSDVKFTFPDGTMIYAHKIVLAMASKVFSVMFEHDKGNEVKIVDVSKNVMMELFRFIYYGKVNGMKSVAQELFVAADKYEIMELKEMCEKALLIRLDTDNAMDVLVLSEMYDNESLKTQATKHILTHIKDIVKMDHFNALVSSCRPCIVGLIKDLAQRD